LANAGKELTEHLLSIDAIMKAGATRLNRAGDVVEATVEDEVTKGPRS
jgi:hypothetical protein